MWWTVWAEGGRVGWKYKVATIIPPHSLPWIVTTNKCTHTAFDFLWFKRKKKKHKQTCKSTDLSWNHLEWPHTFLASFRDSLHPLNPEHNVSFAVCSLLLFTVCSIALQLFLFSLNHYILFTPALISKQRVSAVFLRDFSLTNFIVVKIIVMVKKNTSGGCSIFTLVSCSSVWGISFFKCIYL